MNICRFKVLIVCGGQKVKIQKCERCGTKFNYMDLQKSFWFGKGYVECENCQTTHSQIGITRIIFLILLIIFPIGFKSSIIRLLSPNISLILFLYFLYEVLIIALIPYIIRYKSKT